MCIRRCSPFSILLIVSHPLRFISRPWRFSVMWFYLFILLFVCVRACSRRPFLLAYVLIMYLKTKPNMINLISSRQHGLIKGIIHLSSCFAAQTFSSARLEYLLIYQGFFPAWRNFGAPQRGFSHPALKKITSTKMTN